jgi:broad specificity phosphatase PhoE
MTDIDKETTPQSNESHKPLRLSKRWFILRHGHSEANEAGLIASQPITANNAYGLTLQGNKEVEQSVRLANAELLLKGTPLLISSPLLRTRQTAAIAARLLNCNTLIDNRLRERDFGDLEGMPDSHYQKVWVADTESATSNPWQVETVYDVAKRTRQLLVELEEQHDADTGIIVTHCDTAMILTCAVFGIDPRQHRSLDPIRTGEVRALKSPQQSV